jgi:hypothetical protein
LKAWQQSIAAHQSQASTFWPDRETMEAKITQYAERLGGGALWD